MTPEIDLEFSLQTLAATLGQPKPQYGYEHVIVDSAVKKITLLRNMLIATGMDDKLLDTIIKSP